MRRGLIAVFARHGLLANLLMIVIFALGGEQVLNLAIAEKTLGARSGRRKQNLSG
jgi:hypothetical protein